MIEGPVNTAPFVAQRNPITGDVIFEIPLSGPELALALGVVLAASAVTGLVGFGMGMVVSPILLLVLDPQSVVTTINSLSILVLAMVGVRARHDLPVARVLPLALAGLLAVPIGVLILSTASPGPMRIAIASLVLVLAIPSVLRVQRPLPWARVLGPLIGFLGAMMVTGMGVGVPLVALFLVNQGWSARSIRASIAVYYLFVGLEAVVLYAATGLYTLERLSLTLALAPGAVLGFGLASLLMRRINDRVLRYIVMVVIIAASLGLLLRELAG